MKMLTRIWNERRDVLVGALLSMASFALYVRTLAPSVAFLFDDTLEYQYVIPRLGIIHPTGYPFFTLLGKLFTLLVPLNDPAFRLNLLSAINGALAVGLLYLVARQLAVSRLAALVAALIFSVGQTFWSQAVIAESYTTQMLLVAAILWFTLRYATRKTQNDLYLLAFTMGLGLTHHRLILLLYPAIALYVLLVNRNLFRDIKTLARAALLFLAPLVLYLYLPLRGNVGSADGTYENTFLGFIAWILAQQYTVFLTSNPLAVQHDAAYYWGLFQNQFTLAGLALALIGILGLLRRPREWTLLTVALVLEAGFAFSYRTANVYVHFLTTFLLLALFLAVGIDALLEIFSQFAIRNLQFILQAKGSAFTLCFLIPACLLVSNYPTNDLSSRWDIHDYGIDMLAQPLENNVTIIGIGGEMTLIRYFQENLGLRPDVQTMIGDKDSDRLQAIDDALKQNRVVYTTRPLKGLAEKYSLSSLGSLVRVLPKPSRNAPPMAHLVDEPFGVVQLIGYDVDASRLSAIPNRWHAENGDVLRITLYWRVDDQMDADAMVSVKILRQDQRVIGQLDRRPVLDAYPTTAWRKGEVIADTYDVPLFLGATPSDYSVNVTMYDRALGAVIGQKNLETIVLTADVFAPRRDLWNIAHTLDADFSALSLEGYSLDLENATTRAGDALPLTLLWRAGQNKLPDNLLLRVWLEDAESKTVASRDAPISVGYPPFQWQANSYVRDWAVIRLPANVANGKYRVKLAVSRHNELLGSSLLPFIPTVVDLGEIEIKNRSHEIKEPAVKVQLEATFDSKIRLLGYDVKPDMSQRLVPVTLWWKSLASMDTPYSVFVHLLDVDNQVVAAADAEPGNGTLPTTGWIPNEYLADIHTLTLPADLPRGVYQIEIGVYDPTTGARLKTIDGQARVILRTVDVP